MAHLDGQSSQLGGNSTPVVGSQLRCNLGCEYSHLGINSILRRLKRIIQVLVLIDSHLGFSIHPKKVTKRVLIYSQFTFSICHNKATMGIQLSEATMDNIQPLDPAGLPTVQAAANTPLTRTILLRLECHQDYSHRTTHRTMS
jgi:hypothetical protein